ncbi:hypothetical protein [Terrabacter carboxydivorans]|uniref:Uncharacterized protein n=1 Tax=Terrabacter carboxydivorans TaxID=619730 RepID=A0ABN3KV22_9MICO
METELFVHFAEIAGVFVGFGALISLRSAHVTDVHDVVYLEAVLALGVWVVVSALVPVVVSRYGVVGHALWLPAALLALAIWVVFLVSFTRRPETRALNRSVERLDRFFPVVGRARSIERSREMTEHALRCRAHDIVACPRFAQHVADLTEGHAPKARIADWS